MARDPPAPRRASTWRSTAAAAPGWPTSIRRETLARDGDAGGLGAACYGPLVATLQKGAVEASDPDLQAQLWAMTARLLEEHARRRRAGAIEAWRAALAARPDDRRRVPGARAAAVARRRARPSWSRCWRSTSRSPPTPASARLIAKRIAVLYEDALKQREQAVRAWETVLEIDAGDVEALDALAQLHCGGRRLPRAGRGLRSASWSSRSGREDRRAAARCRARASYDEKLSEPDAGGRASCARCWRRRPATREALGALDRIFTREGRHADLRRGAGHPRGGSRTSAAGARRARVPRRAHHRDRAVRRRGGIGRYQRILAAHARATPARARRCGPSRAATTTACRRSRRWSRCCARRGLGRRSSSCSSCAWRSRTRSSSAAGGPGRDRAHRGDWSGATSTGVRGLGARADRGGDRGRRRAQALERLAAATGDWKRLADGLRGAHGRDVRRVAAALAGAAAGRRSTRRSWPIWRAPRDFLRKALALPGDEAPVLASLEAILRRQGEHAELAEILAREAEVATDPGEQADFLAALGEVRLARARGRRRRAGGVPRRPRAQPGARAGARRRCTSCSIGPRRARARSTCWSRSPRRAATTRSCSRSTSTALELHDDRAERAPLAAQDRRGRDADSSADPRSALDALGRALKEEPMPGAALDDLERIAGAAKLPGGGRRAIEAALGDAEPDAARELALRAARLYEHERRGDAAGGRAALRARAGSRSRERRRAGGARGLLPRRRATSRAWRRSWSGARRSSSIRRRARKRLLEAARAARAARRRRRGAIAALQTLRAAEEGDAEALDELARLLRGGEATWPELATSLAERARFTEDPRRTRRALGARRRAAARHAERPGRRGRGVSRGAGGRARRSDRRWRRWRPSRSGARTGRRCRRC